MRVDTTAGSDLFVGGLRLDASYHASPGQHATKQLTRCGRKLERLDQVCLSGGVYIPGRFKRIFVDDPKHGAPYLTGGSILQAEPLQGAKLLSYRYTNKMDRLALREKIILITCSGEIGKTVYVNGTFQGAVGSPDLIRVLADPDKIPSGYLYAYLSSPLARALIQQKTYGAVIPHIEAHHVVDLSIPRLDPADEARIHQWIEQTAELRSQANYKKQLAQSIASQILDIQLNIYDSKSHRTAVSVNALNDRFEAAYHIAQKATASFGASSFSMVPLGDLLERIFYLGKLHRVFVDDPRSGVPLLSIPDAQKAKLSSDKHVSRTLSRNIGQAMLQSGWILISRVGTPGLVIYTRREMEGFAGTDHLVRLIPKHNCILPGYLFSLLSSPIGQEILVGSAHGSVQMVLPPEYIMQIKIPVPPLDLQKKIHNLIEEYGDNLTKASELEGQAQVLLTQMLGIAK